MNIGVLLGAVQPIPAHALLALGALLIGAVQFALPKGTIVHRSLGYLWVGAMAFVAASRFFINEFRWVGPFGPIHLLSCLVLVTLWRSIAAARRYDIARHRSEMIQLYGFGLILTGAFTLMPGRIMHAVFFG